MSLAQYAVIKEQGVTFAVVVVKDHIAASHVHASDAVDAYTRHFGVPAIVLGASNRRYYGRRDLVNFMSKVPLQRVPWRRGHIA